MSASIQVLAFSGMPLYPEAITALCRWFIDPELTQRAETEPIRLGSHIRDAMGQMLIFDGPRSHPVASVTATHEIAVPLVIPAEPGIYRLELEPVVELKFWASYIGRLPTVLTVERLPDGGIHVEDPEQRRSFVLEAFPRDQQGLFYLPDVYREINTPASERYIEIPWVLSRYRGEARVLDVGTVLNDPGYLNPLAALNAPTLIGVNMVSAKLGVQSLMADLRHLPLHRGSIDLIYAVSIIQRIGREDYDMDGDLSAVRELARLLAPGGRLLITIPFGVWEDHSEFVQYDTDRLRTLIAASDLSLDELEGYFYTTGGWQGPFPHQRLTNCRYGQGSVAASGLVCLTLIPKPITPVSSHAIIPESGGLHDEISQHTQLLSFLKHNIRELAEAIVVECSIQESTTDDIKPFYLDFAALGLPTDAWYHIDFTAGWNRHVLFEMALNRLKRGGVLVLITDSQYTEKIDAGELVLIQDNVITIQPGVAARVMICATLNMELHYLKAGFPLFVNASDPGPITNSIRLHEFWEQQETAFFLEYIQPGHVVVDIGANIGYHTVLAAHRVKASGRVIAVEPDPMNTAILRRNLDLTPYPHRIKIVRAAAGEHNGEGLLYRAPFNLGDHRMFDVTGADMDVDNGLIRGSLLVKILRMDDLLADEQRIDIIKLDTQGFEVPILRGMLATIERHHPLIALEFWPWGVSRAGYDVMEVWHILLRLGYRFYRIETYPNALPLDQSAVMAISGDDYLDLVAVFG